MSDAVLLHGAVVCGIFLGIWGILAFFALVIDVYSLRHRVEVLEQALMRGDRK
jgi:hypothetical protein